MLAVRKYIFRDLARDRFFEAVERHCVHVVYVFKSFRKQQNITHIAKGIGNTQEDAIHKSLKALAGVP